MQATRGSWVSLKIGRSLIGASDASADKAVIDQIKHERDANPYWLRHLAAGFRPYRDEIADARHRFADASGILDQNPDIHGRKRPSDVTTSN